MQRLFEDAQYARAAELYDDAVDSGERPANDAVLLRARVFVKIDSKRIVPFLLKHDLNRPAPAQTARRAMYLGTGYARLGEIAEADKHFEKAKSIFRDGPALAELAAHLTRRYADQRDFETARKWHAKTRLDRTSRGKTRSEHLNAYICAREAKYREQADSLMAVLDLIGEKREQFPEDWYCAVHTLAGLARELPLPAAAKRAKAEVDVKIEWSDDFITSHFQALKAVAWCQALAGDELSCLRYLRLAQHLDTRPIWQVILHLDRSFFAAVVGEHQWALNEYLVAEALAETIEWDETSGEERVALLLLAELAARHAPKRAPFYIARFNNLGKLRNRLQHFAFDDRLQAMAAYASGVSSLASGNKASAEEHLRSAWTVFDRIGYDVRAGTTALALYRATGKARWLHLAEDKLEAYPRAWLVRNLHAAQPASPLATPLSRMQLAVTQLVCEGLSTDAIAERLGLSRNTILNHLKVVYRKVGVNSRGGLVVEAMKRNIVGDQPAKTNR
jgi:DNA-binding CsgD family transcriptional regulator